MHQEHSGTGDNIGRDKYVITVSNFKKYTKELIEILIHRAKEINEYLSTINREKEVQDFLVTFNDLHIKHIKALEEDNIFLAHEILIKIHKISFELESHAFSKRQNFNIQYRMRDDAFQRGELLCKYVVNDLEKYSDKYPGLYSKFESWRFDNGENLEEYEKFKNDDISKVYSLIFNSK